MHLPDAPGRRVLGVFAKWPAPGTVKTRLAAGAPPGWGAEIAEAFLRDTLLRLSGIPARRVLAFAPPEADADFAALAGDRYARTPQQSGDLGRRLEGFIREELKAGADAVVVVGTDSPTLPPAHVGQAFAALESADMVLGPAADGGYYLLGCGRRLPPVFDGVAWGTGGVLAETVARLADPSWRLSLLPPWYDVDTPGDWAFLCGHLAALRRAGLDPGVPHTEALAGRGSGSGHAAAPGGATAGAAQRE